MMGSGASAAKRSAWTRQSQSRRPQQKITAAARMKLNPKEVGTERDQSDRFWRQYAPDEWRQNGWRITRPLAGVPFLLTIKDYTVGVRGPHGCEPTYVDCLVDQNNSFSPVHFPHAAEAQFACWSLFRQHPTLHPRFILGRGTQFSSAPWTEALWALMEVERHMVEQRRGPQGCAVIGQRRNRNSGWLGSEQSWFIARSDAGELQQRLFKRSAPERGIVKVGLINRAGSRRVVNADLLAARLIRTLARHNLSRSYSLSHINDLGDFSFEEQAHWVHEKDVIIAPHGAQNTNFVWARRCTSILEIYPANYFIPGLYLQLARAAGAVIFAAHQGRQDMSKVFNYRLRRAVRSRNIFFDVEAAASTLKLMLDARLQCLGSVEM